jgi:hypothetical protein
MNATGIHSNGFDAFINARATGDRFTPGALLIMVLHRHHCRQPETVNR